VSLSQPVSQDTTVQYSTGPGTALAGSDFVASSGTLTFLSGSTSATISINVIGDTVVEPDETFNVTLSNPTGGLTISDGLGVVTITNDDAPQTPSVSVTSTNGAEGGAAVVITFSRTGTISSALTVNATRGGTSSAADVTATPTVVGGTWNSSNNTVTFNANSSTVTITFAVVDDASVEGTETLIFTLSAGTGYTVGSPASTTANITDNDPSTPTVTVAATNGAEGGAPVTFTLSRTGSTTGTLQVAISRSGATSDVAATPTVTGGSISGSTVTFAAGSASVTLSYAVIDDAVDEGLETISLTIGSGSYIVGTPGSATANITDNDAPATLPTLSINNATVTEGDNGGPTVTVTLTVTRSGDTSGTSTVNWATANGTALSGSDYTAASGTLTFSAGQSSKTITITIAADKKVEPAEAFTVTLSNATGATITTASGTVNILDNDGALFATAAGASASAQPLTEADAVNLLAVVVRKWIDAGATADQFAGLTIRVADLPGTQLGETLGRTITLDIDAAGWGWALSPLSLTADRMDLASVLAHELGHVLGLEHDDHGVMEEMLAPGESLPAPESSTLTIATGHPIDATTLIAAHDPVRTLEMVAPTRLVHTATVVAHAQVVLPVTRGLIAGPGRAVTEIASQAFSPVSPSHQSEPLTVVLLGLALAALIGRRRGALVRSR
jgi:hypothetical protein